MSHYRKIDPRIWNDAKFRRLTDAGKLAFLFLLTHPHMTAIGAMRASIPGLAAEIGWTAEAFREAFLEASQKGMAEHDEKASLMWLPNFIRYNPPESPNVVKAWANALDLLPECDLLTRVIAGTKASLEGKSEAFREALPEALSKAMPNQEQEQEQEQEYTCEPPAIAPTAVAGAREAPEPTAGAPPTPSAAGALCLALRRAGVEAQPADPRVLALASGGVSVETVQAAAAEACRTKGPGERVPVGYVIRIVERWAQEARDRDVAGARAPPKGGLGRIAETVAAFTGFGASGGENEDGRVVDGCAQRIAG